MNDLEKEGLKAVLLKKVEKWKDRGEFEREYNCPCDLTNAEWHGTGYGRIQCAEELENLIEEYLGE